MRWIRIACPYLFLVLCLASGLFQAWSMPPYQGADELAHLYRANLTTFGQPVSERIPGRRPVAGGETDQAVYQAMVVFDALRFDPGNKVDAADFALASRIRWDGRVTLAGFPASAVYPPFFYFPQSAGLALGKLLNLTVVQSMVLARIASVLVCTLVAFAALMIAGRARLLMFALLLLPMSTALYSTMTTDGLLIAATALGCALLSRGINQGRPLMGREVAAAAICFAMVGMTKAPYAFLGLMFLFCDTERRAWRYWAAGAVIGLSAAWAVWMSVAVSTDLLAPGARIDAARQLQYLLGHPLAVFQVAGQTMRSYANPYAHMFIGVLGWLDTSLPETYHRLAWIVLALAVGVSLSRGRSPEWRRLPLVALVTALLCFGAVHGAMYLAWTPVGADHVEGVQGRYFIPLALTLSLLVEGERPLAPQGRWSDLATRLAAGVVLAFPLVSLLVVERAIIVRYYLD